MEPGGYIGGGTPAACVLSNMDGVCSGPRRFELEFVREKVADTVNSP